MAIYSTMTPTQDHPQPRSPFTDEEFNRLPMADRERWFRIFRLMHQANAPLDLARRAVEAVDEDRG